MVSAVLGPAWWSSLAAAACSLLCSVARRPAALQPSREQVRGSRGPVAELRRRGAGTNEVCAMD